MPCYICLEEDGVLMTSQGCACKGSVEIHESCLQEWIVSAENPFQCSVCKTEFQGTFLTKFMSVEEIMFHGRDEEEEIDDMIVTDQFMFHGIPVIETEDGWLLFKNTEHQSIYDQTLERQFRDIKYQSRRQHQKHQRQHHTKQHTKQHSMVYKKARASRY